MAAKYTAEEPKFTQIPDWVLWHPDLSGNDKQIYGTLRRFANFGKGDVDGAKPGMRRMATLCGISKTTVSSCVANLEAVGAIVVDRSKDAAGRQRVNEYYVRWREPVPISDTGPVPDSDTGPVPMVGTYREPDIPILRTDIAPRAQNVWWNAMTDVFGYEPDPNTAEPGLWGKAIKVMKADPGDNDPRQELIRRVLLYVDTHKDAPVTVAAIMNKWRWLGGQMASLDTSRRGALRKAAERDDATQRLSQWVQRREAG